MDLLRALNSGHRGGMTTLHANQVAAVPSRLVALGLLAGLNPQATSALAQDAFDVVLHVGRVGGVGASRKSGGSNLRKANCVETCCPDGTAAKCGPLSSGPISYVHGVVESRWMDGKSWRYRRDIVRTGRMAVATPKHIRCR